MKLIDVTAAFLLVVASACAAKPTDRFEWLPALSAPAAYPITVLAGALSGPSEQDYTSSLAGFGVIAVGWGQGGGVAAIGPDLRSVPDKLAVTWYSFMEDKFYSGHFTLPRERMMHLFAAGYYDFDIPRKQKWDYVYVGLAPGGLVVVWLAGGGFQIEVASFKAVEVSIDLKTVGENLTYLFKPEFRAVVIEEIAEKFKDAPPLPPHTIWEDFRARYEWRPAFVFPSAFKRGKFFIQMFNGETEIAWVEQNDFDAFKMRAVPKKVDFYWLDEAGKGFGAEIDMDQEETRDAYTKLCGENLDRKCRVQLVFRLKEKRDAFTITLEGDQGSVVLTETDQSSYPLRR